MSKKLLVLTSMVIALTANFANAQNNIAATTNQNSQAAKTDNKLKPALSAERKEQKDELRETLKSNPACKNILDTCQKMGFVAGGFKEGNGLWRNCFHPVIAGKAVTQRGNPVTVNVNPSDIAACKAAAPKEKFEKIQNPENKIQNAASEKLGNINSELPNKEKHEKRRMRNAKENLTSHTSANESTTKQQ